MTALTAELNAAGIDALRALESTNMKRAHQGLGSIFQEIFYLEGECFVVDITGLVYRQGHSGRPMGRLHLCSACSGDLEVEQHGMGLATLSVCQRCGGVEVTGTRAEVVKLVDLDAPLTDEDGAGGPVYFDATMTDMDRRVHGWFNPESRRVVQIG